jgi:putative ABC transport system permease protein
MQLGESIKIALGSLRANKIRTFLTLLGNIVGVVSTVAVVSIIDGMNRYVREEIAEEGSNVITLAPRNELEVLSNFESFLESLRNPDITLADRDFIRGRLQAEHAVGARVANRARIGYRGRAIDGVPVEGWTVEVGVIRSLDLEAGRSFTPLETDTRQPVALIGSDVAEKLFRDEHPLDHRTRIGDRHFRVIGVLAEKAAVAGSDPNLRVLIPIGVFHQLYGPRTGTLTIPVRVAAVEDNAAVIEEITAAMRVRHRLRPDQRDDFAVITSEALIDLWGSISRSIFTALIFLVSLSLVVGGIVIMNIMLVSVNERTREVGVRKAIGARRRDILRQFLVEAVTLSATGGVIGVVGGFMAAALIARFTPLPYAVKPWSILVSLLATGAVGIFFGLYPASRAARLDPVDALRHE